MRQIIMLTESLFCFCLTGCSAAAYFLSGRGRGDANLAVFNGRWAGRS